MELSQSAKTSVAGSSWFAVRVKTTHEKRVTSLLDHQGYEWLLPLYRCRRRWSDRIRQVELPVFPGYVFCRFVPCARVSILKTSGVLGIAGSGLIPTPVDDQEIAAIQRVVKSRFSISPHPFLRAGRRVRIESGSLCGLEGLVTEVRRDRLILSVHLLQRSVAVEIDEAWVSPP